MLGFTAKDPDGNFYQKKSGSEHRINIDVQHEH